MKKSSPVSEDPGNGASDSRGACDVSARSSFPIFVAPAPQSDGKSDRGRLLGGNLRHGNYSRVLSPCICWDDRVCGEGEVPVSASRDQNLQIACCQLGQNGSCSNKHLTVNTKFFSHRKPCQRFCSIQCSTRCFETRFGTCICGQKRPVRPPKFAFLLPTKKLEYSWPLTCWLAYLGASQSRFEWLLVKTRHAQKRLLKQIRQAMQSL